MSENQPQVKKRNLPLAALLLAAQIVVNWRKLLGLFTGAASLANGGWLGIAQYLVDAVTALVPVIMLVLLFLNIMKEKPNTPTIGLMCFIMGAALLIDFGLTCYQLYVFVIVGAMDFYEIFFQFASIAALLVYGIGMLQIGSRLRKGKLRSQCRSYVLIFYLLLLAPVMSVVVPGFMDWTVSLSVGNLLNYALLMAAGFFLPAALLDNGEKSRPASIINVSVTVMCALVIFLMGGTIGYSSYVDSHAMPEVTTVTCPVCHKKYTDNSNKRSIQRKNMCNSCSTGYEATKDALGW